MQRRSIDGLSASIPMYALGAIFLVPLTIGVLLVSTNASQNDQANQISRDVVSMYAQGMDFSQSANQNIAIRVAERLGMKSGDGVLILTKLRVVHDSDCASKAGCTNRGHAVIVQRYVMGNAALRQSSFGTPPGVDAATGNIPNWANDVAARAQDFSPDLKSGEYTYAAECYLMSPESHTGVYSRVIY